MITLQDVSKTYHETQVLGPVNVEIVRGGITALIGANGAGKSTMLTIIGRLLDSTSGSVTVSGMDVAQTKSRDLAKVLSILRQENHFITRLTVRQLVSFGRFPHSQGHLTIDDEWHIEHALEFLNLHNLADRFIDELSGGQRQRAYVAMVLAQDTEYLLLDEPLNNLDMKHSVAMMKQLRRAADELGKTIVIVLHDVNFAAAYADHVIALCNGVVTHTGPVSDIMTSSVLCDVFDTPIDVVDGPGHPIAVFYR